MILIDAEGNKIVAGVKHFMFQNNFTKTVVEGKYLIVENFGVQPYNSTYKLVQHRFKLQFGRLTRATLTDEFSISSYGFNPVNYDDLIKFKYAITEAIDVVGQLHSVQNKKEKVEDNVVKTSIDFYMRDMCGKQVKGTVWGQHADQLAEIVSTHLNDESPIVIMIHNAKLGKYLGEPQVSNQLFGCRIFSDPTFGPLAEFLKMMNEHVEDGLDSIPLASQDFGTDRKTALDEYKVHGVPIIRVDDIRFIREDSYCVTKAEVKKICSEIGWFSYACGNCHEKLGNKVMSPGGEWVHHCTTCGGNTTDIIHKLRMTVQVADQSGSATFVLFASQLSKMLKRSVSWLNTKMINVGNPSVVPDEIAALISKEYVFKVRVSNFNVGKDYDSYTVDKVTEDVTVITVIGQELEQAVPSQVTGTDVSTTPCSEIGHSKFSDGSDWTPSSVSLKRKSESPVDLDEPCSSASSKACKGIESLKIPRMSDITDGVEDKD